jgi:aspartate--ammonia ligase
LESLFFNHTINKKQMATMKTSQVVLSELATERAISDVKLKFSTSLGEVLNLVKVEAPLLVVKGTGINDDLNGIESPVTVHIKEMPEVTVEIVHSLAKWKRAKLARLKAPEDLGIYTDMKALRPDEDFSPIHSIYVDQWDWEKVISKSDRTLSYLKSTVKDIYKVLLETSKVISEKYDLDEVALPEEITFIHTEDLLQEYPSLTAKEREDRVCKEFGAVFLIGIGGDLIDGKPHDGRAPDYDDWTTESVTGKKGLNGDILVWNEVLGRSFELSSMGIRVSPESLLEQLKLRGQEHRLEMEWHKQLLAGKLPYTIGGGIGQSRLAMFLLKKSHIGEVQSSIWSDFVLEKIEKSGLKLL